MGVSEDLLSSLLLFAAVDVFIKWRNLLCEMCEADCVLLCEMMCEADCVLLCEMMCEADCVLLCEMMCEADCVLC